MQPRRHRMCRQRRRESARGWIASGATVTIKTYARRYGVDRYTAHEDLTAIGLPLPASAQHWAQRPPPTPRPRRRTAPDISPPDTHWIMMDGRPYFVAGYTSGGVPYGMFEDEMHDLDDLDHDPDALPSLPDGGLCGPDDGGRTETSRPPETTLRDEASHPAPF
jgi:hypothetical protein